MKTHITLMKLSFLSMLLLTSFYSLQAQVIELRPLQVEERSVIVFEVPDSEMIPADVAKAEKLAKEFVAALFLQQNSLLEMVEYPFAFDKKMIFANEEELKEEILGSVDDMSYSKEEVSAMIKSLTAKTIKRQKEIMDYLIPVDYYIVSVKFTASDGSKHGCGLAIKIHPVPKVIGFSD